MTDFNEWIDFSKDIETTLYGKPLILKGVHMYEGPITLQYIPYGGIQSVFYGNLIINVKNGYVCPNKIIYDNVEYTPKEFTSKFEDLVNQILPN